MTQKISSLDLHGDTPPIVGARCDALLARAYWHGEVLVEPANVAHLCFGGTWHRLYFDHGAIFWAPDDGPPGAWEAPEGGAWTLVDVATAAGVKGARLERLTMAPTPRGSRVRFEFGGGRAVTFEDADDVTHSPL